MINRLHTVWHEEWFSLLFSSILRGVLFTRLSEMASVICALVSDWCVFASIRLQLHLPPGVREPGPAGLQPEGQRAWTNSISQKPLLLHSPSTQGERSKHTKESYFCEEKAFESYLWDFPGHRWRANTFIWEWVCWTLFLCYFAEVYVSHDWIMAEFISPHLSKPTLLHNLLHNMLSLLLLLLLGCLLMNLFIYTLIWSQNVPGMKYATSPEHPMCLPPSFSAVMASPSFSIISPPVVWLWFLQSLVDAHFLTFLSFSHMNVN